MIKLIWNIINQFLMIYDGLSKNWENILFYRHFDAY